MKEVKLYKTTLKGLKVLALTIPFVVIGIWMITKSDSSSTERGMGLVWDTILWVRDSSRR